MRNGVPFSALSRAPAPGNELTTEEKISSDMPLPMPRWLMSSPIHMSSAVPAVSVSTTMITAERREVGQHVEAGGVATAAEQATAAVVEQERQAGGLQQRDGHREVAGPLGDLALPHRAHLLPLLQLRDHHGEDLHDDRRRDVRHDPEGEDGELGERAAGEQLEEAHHAAAALGLALQLLDGVEVDARRRDVGAHPVQGDDEQREEDLPPEVGDPEDVPDARQHGEGSWSAAGRRPRSVGSAVGELVALHGGTPVAPGLGQDLNGTAGGGDGCLGGLREGVGLHGDLAGQLAPARAP